MAEMYAVKKDDLTAIADAIRTKRDITGEIEIPDMAMQIGLIEGGGIISPEDINDEISIGMVVAQNTDYITIENPFDTAPIFASIINLSEIKNTDIVFARISKKVTTGYDHTVVSYKEDTQEIYSTTQIDGYKMDEAEIIFTKSQYYSGHFEPGNKYLYIIRRA